MIRLLLFLVVVTALAFVAYWLALSGGTVAVDWLGYNVTVQVGIAIALLLALIAACIALFMAYRYLVKLPREVKRHREQKRRMTGYQELATGLIAAAAGDASQARTHSRKAEKLLNQEAATLLLTAQTAQLEGKEDLAQLKFRQMLRKPETEFLGLRGLLADAIKRNDLDEALDLVEKAKKRSPNTPWVLTTSFDLYTRKERWADAYGVVDDMARLQLLRDTEVHRRRGLLRHVMAEEALGAGRKEDAFTHAKHTVKLLPAFAPGAVTAARAAVENGRPRDARKFLERAWKAEPHPDVAHAYAEMEPDEQPKARYKRFERLLKLNPNNKVTRLVMAEMALAAKEFDEAKKHLEEARKIEPSAGVYRLYADFERASGGGENQARAWLAKAIDAPSDRAWVCEDSGEVLPNWQLFGPSGRFDSVHWDYPPRVAQLVSDQRPTLTLTADATSPSPDHRSVQVPQSAATGKPAGKPRPDMTPPDSGKAEGRPDEPRDVGEHSRGDDRPQAMTEGIDRAFAPPPGGAPPARSSNDRPEAMTEGIERSFAPASSVRDEPRQRGDAKPAPAANGARTSGTPLTDVRADDGRNGAVPRAVGGAGTDAARPSAELRGPVAHAAPNVRAQPAQPVPAQGSATSGGQPATGQGASTTPSATAAAYSVPRQNAPQQPNASTAASSGRTGSGLATNIKPDPLAVRAARAAHQRERR